MNADLPRYTDPAPALGEWAGPDTDAFTVELREALEAARSGVRLSREQGLGLYLSAPSEALFAAADARRAQTSDPSRVTYLVDRNINYTNVCITDCKFCEFYRPPGHAESYVLTRGILREKLQELTDAGGTRVLLQGGHHPELRIDFYRDLLRFIRTEFPRLQIDGFSPSEIEHLAALEVQPTAAILADLKDHGLGGLPGGGGEILDDEIRQHVSPKKIKTEPWLRIMGEAHALGLYTSATQVIGFGEHPKHRIAALTRLRDRQDSSLKAYGLGFMAFAAWPLLFESRYGRVFGELKGWHLGASAEEYLRHIALCRLYLDNFVHFQASWPTMGLEVAARALRAGCDDMGGTMMEENVVSQAGSTHCSAPEESMREAILNAGFEPVKRDSFYRDFSAEPR